MARPKTNIDLIANERIKSLIKKRGMTQIEFAKAVHYSQAAINKVVCGKTAVTKELIDNTVKAFPEINPLWLSDESEYELAEGQRLFDEYVDAQREENKKVEFWKDFLANSSPILLNIYVFTFHLYNIGYRAEFRELTGAEAETNHSPFAFDIVDKKTKKIIVSLPVWETEHIANEIADYAEYLIKKRLEEKHKETANNSDGADNYEV